jgi:hypothetical protein
VGRHARKLGLGASILVLFAGALAPRAVAVPVDLGAAARADLGAAPADPVAFEAALASAEARWDSQGALGEYRDPASGALVVDVPAALLDAFSLGPVSAIGLPVETRAVGLDQATRDKVLKTIDGFLELPSMAGESSAYYFDAQLAKIYLDTTVSEAAINAALGDLASLVAYYAGGVSDTATRCTDTPPFWGGGAADLNSSDGCSPPHCTTGFTVHDASGTAYGSTAGHCFAEFINVWTPAGLYFGSAVSPHCNGGSVDFERLGNANHTYGSYVYTGTTKSSTSALIVQGAADPLPSAQYKYSGAASYEHGIVAINTSVTVNSPDCGSLTNMVAYSASPSGICPSVNGDSGAPVYTKLASSVSARGNLTQHDNGGLGRCYGGKWSSIAALGLSIGP